MRYTMLNPQGKPYSSEQLGVVRLRNIYQVIDDMNANAMRDLMQDRLGYRLPDDTSERVMRNTIIADYEFGLISGRDIREMGDV